MSQSKPDSKHTQTMRSKTIYLIRHGQTEYNLKGVVQGSGIDAPLNDTGWKQAHAFYKHYRDIPFQRIYTSVLQRSIQTVTPFLDDGLPHTPLEGLNEINWGEKEGKVANDEDHQYYKFIIDSWKKGDTDLAIRGGESPRMVMERQKPALQAILADEEDPVLVCMHGRAMRILLCLMMDHDLSRMDDYAHSNLCLYVLEYDYTQQKFAISLKNEQAHLSRLI